MRSVREKFVEEFGEEQAAAIERAAEYHDNGINSEKGKGSDPFKWAILICIGYECISRDSFRKYHGVTVPFDQLKHWIREKAELASHDGGCDYLTLFCGGYNDFVPEKADA